MADQQRVSRRQWLAAAGCAAALTLAGCSSDDDAGTSGSNDPARLTDETGTGDRNTDNSEDGDTSADTVTAAGHWATEGFNPQNQQYAPEWNGPDGALRERWDADIGVVGGDPVVVNGTVYVGTEITSITLLTRCLESSVGTVHLTGRTT